MIELLGYVAAFLTTASAIPQLVQLIRTRDASGVSTLCWLCLASGVALWLVYGIMLGSRPLIAANAITLVLDVAVVAMSLHFRKRGGPSTSSG